LNAEQVGLLVQILRVNAGRIHVVINGAQGGER
jgi:hypothetical protein